jgi:hypothetical protein
MPTELYRCGTCEGSFTRKQIIWPFDGFVLCKACCAKIESKTPKTYTPTQPPHKVPAKDLAKIKRTIEALGSALKTAEQSNDGQVLLRCFEKMSDLADGGIEILLPF